MSVKHNLEQWVAQLDYDDTCDITDRQVSDLIRNYATLEARCAALAAENAGLKDEISNITFMRDDDFFGSTQRAQEVMGRLVNVKTPATDAFLAEVRAQGADECVRQLVISDDDDLSDAPNICAMVAYQLRKGVI